MEKDSVGKYATIRFLLEHIYTYGIYSRTEFAKLGITPKNYDKLLQLLLHIFPEHFWNTHYENGKKIIGIHRDMYSNDSDTLFASLTLHTGKNSFLIYMALVFSLLSRRSAIKAADAILAAEQFPYGEDQDNQEDQNNKEDQNNLDRGPTIRRQLKAMADFGYISQDGRQKQYVPHPFPELTPEELTSLYLFADFCAGASSIRSAPIMLRSTVRRAMEAAGVPVPGSVFLFRGNACRNILDEEIVYALYVAHQNCKKVKLTLVHGPSFVVAPSYLRFDVRSGRWYLFALGDQGPTVLRLSKIKGVQVLSQQTFDIKEVYDLVQERFRHCNISSGKGKEETVLVEVELHFDRVPGLLDQFKREMLFGEVTRQENIWLYQASVNDPIELVPFLRSYGGYIRILPGQHDLDHRCMACWEEMLRNLEDLDGTV